MSGARTTGRAPVDVCLTEVEADVGGDGEVTDAVTGGQWFFLPEVARLPEVVLLADDDFQANSSSFC